MSGKNRAERRREARAAALRGSAQMLAAAERGEVPIGFYSSTGHFERADAHAGQLPEKVPGRHRWIATAAYVLTDEQVRVETRAREGSGETQFLDHETMFTFAVGCWDCEEGYPDVSPDTICPAPGDDA